MHSDIFNALARLGGARNYPEAFCAWGPVIATLRVDRPHWRKAPDATLIARIWTMLADPSFIGSPSCQRAYALLGPRRAKETLGLMLDAMLARHDDPPSDEWVQDRVMRELDAMPDALLRCLVAPGRKNGWHDFQCHLAVTVRFSAIQRKLFYRHPANHHQAGRDQAPDDQDGGRE